ncbi:MAG: hypothetical protein NTY98_05510 [Verrucomicrobia bacterium]|nr:hypothetical protein [Verrucomicrobiota bacterium]
MTPKEEAERLMNELVPFAMRMLTENGCFLPFGGYINEQGEVVHLGAQIEGEEHSLPSDLLRVLRKELVDLARSGKAWATGVLFDVTVAVPPAKVKSDAIQIDLDHRGDYSVRVYYLHPDRITLPYKCAESGRKE